MKINKNNKIEEKLDEFNLKDIEQYLRKKKLNNINNEQY